MDSGSLFVFGLGYSALALARRLRQQGWRVAGTGRDEGAGAALRSLGIAYHRFDREHPLPDLAAALGDTTHILSSVPPDAAGDPVLDVHGAALVRFAAAHPRRVRWAGYLSTTGVYGDRGGAWVDESAPLAPVNERGRRRVAAERAWLELGERTGWPVHLFRLAGIYGPGRSALDTVRSGQARRIVKPGQVFGRIHVVDIVAVLTASMARPSPGAAYNLADDEPAPPQDVIAHACDLLGVPPPPEEPYDLAAPTLSEMARSFYAESKRVANRRIKEELGVRLAYPDYRAGLAALLRGE